MNFPVSRSVAPIILSVVTLFAPPSSPGFFQQTIDEVSLTAAIGGFRINSNGKTMANGKLRISFKGSVLVNQLQPGGVIKVTGGKLRVEYENDKFARKVYHGEGTLEVTGTFRSIQFLGSNLKANYKGMGIFFLTGDVDSKGNAPTYQYKGQPSRYWPQGGSTIFVPYTPTDTSALPPAKKID